jgi:hypothetical protein
LGDQWIPSNDLEVLSEPDMSTQECDPKWFQFSPLLRAPSNVLLCLKTDYQLPNGAVAIKIIALDTGGALWEWNHAPMDFITYYLFAATIPLFGLMFGFTLAVVMWIMRSLMQSLAA